MKPKDLLSNGYYKSFEISYKIGLSHRFQKTQKRVPQILRVPHYVSSYFKFLDRSENQFIFRGPFEFEIFQLKLLLK